MCAPGRAALLWAESPDLLREKTIFSRNMDSTAAKRDAEFHQLDPEKNYASNIADMMWVSRQISAKDVDPKDFGEKEDSSWGKWALGGVALAFSPSPPQTFDGKPALRVSDHKTKAEQERDYLTLLPRLSPHPPRLLAGSSRG